MLLFSSVKAWLVYVPLNSPPVKLTSFVVPLTVTLSKTGLTMLYFVGFRNFVIYCVSVVSKFVFLKRNKPAPKLC